MEKICVAVRVRPLVSTDSVNGSFWKVEDNRISLHKIHGTPFSGSSYAFDHIFDESSTNSSVYELLTKDIILAALNGFNGTAFAYGQTSSGKTFTMNGCETDPGVIPRAVKDIFAKIETMSEREFLIRVSYMEIYNEEINDLLVVESQKLQIHESLERGVFVAGLREEVVNNAEQVLDLIKAGEVNRHFGETNMNVRSSRSHTIFRMVIESKGKDCNSSDDSSINDIVRVSVLNLVDLAGSERIAKTGADGVRLKEGKYINKSLMVLGNVINKLSEGSKQRGHIPYRDSKLTRILQPALGGNAKTSIICTVAPEEVHIEETKGTLQFASRAKRITNCVQVNEILTDAALLKRQQLEIEELRKKLQGSHAGVLEQEILKLRNDLLKYEMERGKLERELQEERKSRNQWISEQQMKIENSSTASLSVSDCGTYDNQGPRYLRRQGFREEYSDVNSTSHGDIFKSPCLKTASAFVVKRSKHSTLPDSSPLQDSSPLPDAFNNVADEDTWLKMNNGYVANLDSPQTTPTRNFQSFPLSDTTPGCASQVEKYEREVQDLRRQLELANEKINELERKHSEEVLSSKQLIGEIPDNQQETQLIQELPLRLSESVENYKDSFEEVLSVMQRFASDGKFSTEKMLSTMSDIGAQLFATLEGHLAMFTNGEKSSTGNYALNPEPQKEFHEKVKNIITSLELSESSITKNQDRTPLCSCEHKGCASQVEKYEREVQDLRRQLELANEKINELERKHSEEVLSSKQLIGEIPDNQQETQLIQELPLRLSESVENYKDSFEEVLSVMQTFASDGKFSTEKMLSTMSDIGAQLFATLEGHLTMFTNGERSSTGNYALNPEPQKEFHEKVKNIITSLELSESSITKNQDRTPLCSCEHKESGLGGEIASSMDALNERYESLEKELLLLKNERDSLLQKFSESSDKLTMVSNEKENVLKDLNTEVHRRKKLEGEVKQFTSAFVCRQKSLISLRSDLKTKIEKWKAQTPISLPKSFGCEAED